MAAKSKQASTQEQHYTLSIPHAMDFPSRKKGEKRKRNQRVCFPLVSIGNMHIAINAANINAPET